MKDHYKRLGIPVTATRDEIESGFKTSLLNSKIMSEEWEEVFEAHEVLSDISKRVKYDQSLTRPSVVATVFELQSEGYIPEKEPYYQTLSQAAWSMTAAVVFGIGGFIYTPLFLFSAIGFVGWLLCINVPEYTLEREAKKAFRVRREEFEAEQQKALRERAYAQRQEVRRIIEQMPEYQTWRQQVLERDRRKCRVVDCTRANLEVDHRVSLDAIIRRFRITSEGEARGCVALWDVANGLTLCKTHHDQTETSRYRQRRLAE